MKPNAEPMKRKLEKHGMWGTQVYKAWCDMKTRCTNPSAINYKHYGGRGISVCEEWTNSFLSYYNYVSQLPNYGVKGYTIDRIDNHKGYYPDNVKYSTQAEQLSNRGGYGSSKYKGVCWNKAANKWHAQTLVNSKYKHIGYFNTEIEAHIAYEDSLESCLLNRILRTK